MAWLVTWLFLKGKFILGAHNASTLWKVLHTTEACILGPPKRAAEQRRLRTHAWKAISPFGFRAVVLPPLALSYATKHKLHCVARTRVHENSAVSIPRYRSKESIVTLQTGKVSQRGNAARWEVCIEPLLHTCESNRNRSSSCTKH